jgi:hypothetical protein
MTTPVAVRARVSAATMLRHLPLSRPRALAEPPAGSGLKAVMGDPGLPGLGHTFEAFGDPLGSSRRFYAQSVPSAGATSSAFPSCRSSGPMPWRWC